MELFGIALGVIVVAVLRLAIPLTIFRWPFWGGIASAVVDSIDVILIYLMDLGDFKDYHGTDKFLDTYFLVIMAFYSWRNWKGAERNVSLWLFSWRMIGFIAFEITGVRWLLLVFPNIFLWIWVFIAWRNRFKPAMEITYQRAAIVLAIMLGPKLLQETILHIWQLHPVTIMQDFFTDMGTV